MPSQICIMCDQKEDLKGHTSCEYREVISSTGFERIKE